VLEKCRDTDFESLWPKSHRVHGIFRHKTLMFGKCSGDILSS